MTSDEVIARLRREMTDEQAALPDPGMEPRRTVSQQLAEARRVLAEQLAEVNGIDSAVAKCRARVEMWRGQRDGVVHADCEGRAERAATDAERQAWLSGAAYFRGERCYEVPGAVIALCKELNVTHLPTLPAIDAQLEQASADLAVVEARLQSAVDTWERRPRIVRGTIDAELPALQSVSAATVK